MDVAVTLLGALAIGVAITDTFQTLFHPSGRGALSDWTARVIWKSFRNMPRSDRGKLALAGPFAILGIILSWVILVWFGFALLYFPHLHSGFSYDQSIPPTHRHGLIAALNLSIGALITLTDGMTASLPFLQLLRGVEAILGFGLLTASVSWLLSIYPVLELRRSVAQRATLLHHAEIENNMDLILDTPEQTQQWLFALACDLSSLRNQMSQFPITYYFSVSESHTSLPGALPYLAQLAERAAHTKMPGLRLAATMLGGSVKDFLDVTADTFLRIKNHDAKGILRAYAQAHMSQMILMDHEDQSRDTEQESLNSDKSIDRFTS
jgi:hypothetical protein